MIDNKELEEAAGRIVSDMYDSLKHPIDSIDPIDAFIAGATHQDKIAADRTVKEVVGFIEDRIAKNEAFIPVIQEYPLAKAVYTALNSESKAILQFIQNLKK